jgi:predicted PurR-regulated permease PerM
VSDAPAGPAATSPGAADGRGRAGAPLRWLVWAGAAVVVAYLFRSLALPLLLGALVAYLLKPLIVHAEGFAVRRSVAVTGLFVGLTLLLVGAGFLLVPRFRAEGLDLAANLPELAARLEVGIDTGTRELVERYPRLRRYLPVDEPPGWLFRRIEERAGSGDLASQAGAIAFVVLLVPIFAFFVLRDGGKMMGALLDRLPPAHIETSVAAWCEIDQIIGRYLRGLALDGLVVGVLAGLGLWLIGVPYPLLLGAFTALVNPLPYLGTILSVTAAAVVSLAAGQGLGTVGWILGLYLLIRILDDVVIAVVTIGGSVHLHPLLVLASILAGEHALGLVGMVIAVPLVTVIKEIARLLLEHRETLERAHRPVVAQSIAIEHYVS